MANEALNQVLLQALAQPQYMTPDLNNSLAQTVPQWTPNPNDVRANGEQKANGYFGVLPRPGGGVSSEISIGVNLGGKEIQIPTLVPTLNADEVNHLLSMPMNAQVPRPIVDKAVQFAVQRLRSGLSPFASNTEIPYGIKQ